MPPYTSKLTTSYYRQLDVRWLQRNGYLKSRWCSTVTWHRGDEVSGSIGVFAKNGAVILSYRHRNWDGEWQSKEYAVSLEWTPCYFGGERAWFRCPAQGCGRRVAILYGDEIFACRHCRQLAYDSQREPTWERALTRYHAIKQKLGARPADDFPDKPKGMHWRTYNRLCAEAEEASNRSLSPWMPRLFMTFA